MNAKSLGQWFGEATTGHGAAVVLGTLLAVANGAASWQTAIPALAAGLVGIVWPETPKST